MRQKHPPENATAIVMLGSNIMLLFALPLAGSLVLLPPVIVANTVGFAVHLTGWRRIASVAMGCATIALPALAELVGLATPRYRFDGETMHVLASGIDIGGSFHWLLLVVGVSAVVTGAIAVAGVRDQLREAESRLYLYAWHLREFVPATAREKTDASLRKRRRSTRLSRPPIAAG